MSYCVNCGAVGATCCETAQQRAVTADLLAKAVNRLCAENEELRGRLAAAVAK